MTTKQADKLIAQNKPVKLYNPRYDEAFTAHIVRRDRWALYTKDGEIFERNDLQIVTTN